MSSPMIELDEHFLIPVNLRGEGPVPRDETMGFECWCGIERCPAAEPTPRLVPEPEVDLQRYLGMNLRLSIAVIGYFTGVVGVVLSGQPLLPAVLIMNVFGYVLIVVLYVRLRQAWRLRRRHDGLSPTRHPM